MTEREQHPMASDEELFVNHSATLEMKQRSAAALYELAEIATANNESPANLMQLGELANQIGSHLLTLVKVHGMRQPLDFGYRSKGADLTKPPEFAPVVRLPMIGKTELILTTLAGREVYCARRDTTEDEDMYYAVVPVSPPERVRVGNYNYSGMCAAEQRAADTFYYHPLVDPQKTEVRAGYQRVVESLVADTVNAMD